MWGGIKGHQKPVWYWNQADKCSNPSRPCSSCVTLSFSTLPISGTTVCTLQGYCDILLWLMCVCGNLYNIQEPAIGKWVRGGQEKQEGIKGHGEIDPSFTPECKSHYREAFHLFSVLLALFVLLHWMSSAAQITACPPLRLSPPSSHP